MELKACAMGTMCSYSHEVNSYSYCGNALDKDDPKWVKGDAFVFGYSVLGLFMYPKQRTKTSMTNGNKNLCVENRGICHILANNSSHFEKSNSLELKLYRCRSFLPTL